MKDEPTWLTATAAVLAVPITLVVNGLCLKVLWGWFIVEVFGADPLSIPNALGVALVVRFMTHEQLTKKDDRPSLSTWAVISGALLWPLFALAFGAIYRWFA